MLTDAKFIGHEYCGECGSKDNLARYDDGHAYCFGCEHYEPPRGGSPKRKRDKRPRMKLLQGSPERLGKRSISEQTCEFWNYTVGEYKGLPCQIANYADKSGRAIAQKVRFANKGFMFIGDTKAVSLFGRQLWRDGGKKIVITEGEIDALSMSQLQRNKWPVVSVPNGAQSAARAIRKDIEWLEQFQQVIFMFDMDEPGQDAAKECAALLSPGKAFIARLPLKDANECLVAGRGSEVIDAMWGAKAYRPDGIVSIDEIMEDIRTPVETGLPWCFPKLTDMTYGRRYGEIYAIGAGTGAGKTDFMTQQSAFDMDELGQNVGMIYLEQRPVETGNRLAGKAAHRRFHVPDSGWTEEEQDAALIKLDGRAYFYDSWGETEWPVVATKIRYMAVSLGIRHFFLDHLTAMADPADERVSIETVMKEMAGLANELNIIIHFVSHLATPEGRPHEEGGRVMLRHFKGSRAIGFWSFFAFGMERNQQAKDSTERQTTTFRVLKDRYTGQSTGKTFSLGYDAAGGMLYETEDCPFDGEEQEDDDGDF